MMKISINRYLNFTDISKITNILILGFYVYIRYIKYIDGYFHKISIDKKLIKTYENIRKKPLKNEIRSIIDILKLFY